MSVSIKYEKVFREVFQMSSPPLPRESISARIVICPKLVEPYQNLFRERLNVFQTLNANTSTIT